MSVNHTCNLGDIRLVDGDTELSGRLEVCIDNTWGTVCNRFGGWGEEESNVACSQLGYASVGMSHVIILRGAHAHILILENCFLKLCPISGCLPLLILEAIL